MGDQAVRKQPPETFLPGLVGVASSGIIIWLAVGLYDVAGARLLTGNATYNFAPVMANGLVVCGVIILAGSVLSFFENLGFTLIRLGGILTVASSALFNLILGLAGSRPNPATLTALVLGIVALVIGGRRTTRHATG